MTIGEEIPPRLKNRKYIFKMVDFPAIVMLVNSGVYIYIILIMKV